MAWLRRKVSPRYGAMGGIGKAIAVWLALAAPVQAQEVVIAALGDSLTAGYGLPRGQGLVPQLQDWLDGRGHDARLINAGVSGDTTAGGLARVDWTLGDDVDGMIVALGGNDLLRGIDPGVSRANLDGILSAADAAGVEVLVIGMRAFNNFGEEYQAAYDAMYPELAEAHGALFHEDFLGAISGVDTSGQEGFLPRYIQADGLHPNAVGVARIVEDIGPAVEALIQRAGQP